MPMRGGAGIAGIAVICKETAPTVSVAVPLILLSVAVIVEVAPEVAVLGTEATPVVATIVAAAVLLDDHVAVEVTSLVLPSE